MVETVSKPRDILTDTADIQPKLGTPVTDIAADIADLITRTKGLDDIHDDIVVDTFRKVTKTITLSEAAVPVTETLFTVTGEVEVIVIGYTDTAITSAAGALTLEVGISGNTAGLIAQTGKAALLIDLLWVDNTPATLITKPSPQMISNGSDIIHTIAGAAADAACSITYYCYWKPLSSDGNVVSA